MEQNNSTAGVLLAQDPPQQTGMPGWAIAILVVGVVIIVVIVLFLILRSYGAYSQRMAKERAQELNMSALNNERERLFSGPVIL